MGKRRRPLCTPPFPARTFQCTLDKFLSQKQLWRKPIAKDGSCLFRAVAEQVSLSQNCHHRVRLQCADYIRTHQDDFKEFLTMSLDEYLGFLTDAQLWGGEVELVALSKLYSRSIIVYNEQENGVQEQVFPCTEEERASSADDLANPILLAYSDGNHYDSVYTKAHKNNMAFCQAIVYSLFYERVVADRIPLHCRQRLRQLSESDFHKLPEMVNDDHSIYLLSTHYSTDSIAAMTSSVYHNVAADVYRREKDCKEQQDRCMAANIQFQVGDQCQVRVPGGDFSGEVTALNVSSGCHLVRVYQFQEEWEIPYKDMTLPNPGNKSYVRQGSVTAQPGTRGRPPYPASQQPHPLPHPPPPSSSSSRAPQPTPGRDTQPHNPAPTSGPAPKKPAQRSASAGTDNSANGAAAKYREIPREKERAPPTQPREEPAPRRSQGKQSGSVKLPVARSSVPEGLSVVTTSAVGRETITKPAAVSATSASTSTTTTTSTPATIPSALRSAAPPPKKPSNRDPQVPPSTGIITSKLVTPVAPATADTPLAKPTAMPQTKVTRSAAVPHGSLGPVDPIIVKHAPPASTTAVQTKPAVVPHAKVTKTTTGSLGRLTADDIIGPKLVSPIATATVGAIQTGHTAGGIPRSRAAQKTPPQIPTITSPRLTKTTTGPHGSLTSEDSNYSSSSDESNGNQSTAATPAATSTTTGSKAAGLPKRFAFPAVSTDKLVTGAWESDDHPVDAPRKPVSQLKPSLPKRGEAQHAQREGGTKKDSRATIKPHLPGTTTTTTTSADGPAPYFTTTTTLGKKSPSTSTPSPFLDDRGSPYLERKLPTVESSQPEEAWPMFDSEEPPNPLLHGLLNRSTNLPEGLNMPPGMPFPLPPNALFPVSLGPEFMQIGTNPTLSHFPPFLRAQARTSVQAEAVQVSPSLSDQGTQTEQRTASVTSSQTQTGLQGISTGLISSEELKPPQFEGRNDSPHDQLKFILGYSIQCARVYLQNSPAPESRAKEALAMMERFGEEGLKKLLPQPKTKPDVKTKKDLKMKRLNSDEQTFIQSLSSGRLSTLPLAAVAEGGEMRLPKSGEKQPGVASLAAESDQLAKPGRQGPSKRVVHTQQLSVPAQASDQAARQHPTAKASAKAQLQQLNKTAATKPVQSHTSPGKTPPTEQQQPRPPLPNKVPTDQQPRPPPVAAAQDTTGERRSPNHHAAKTHQPRPPVPPPSKQNESGNKANIPPLATTESTNKTSKENPTAIPDKTPNEHSDKGEEEEEEDPTSEGSAQPSETPPQQQDFVMQPYPHPQMVPPHMMMHPGARPQLVVPMPMPPAMWYPNYHIPMPMPVMVPPFAAPHPMMSHHMMQRGFEPQERQTDGSAPGIQEIVEEQEEQPRQVTEPSTEEGGIVKEDTRSKEGSLEEIAPEAVKKEETRITDKQPPSPAPFAAEATAGEEEEGEEGEEGGEEEEEEEEEEEGEKDEETTGLTSLPEPGKIVSPLPEEAEVGEAVIVTGVFGPEEQDTVPDDGEKSDNVAATSAPVVARGVRSKFSETSNGRKTGSQRQHLPDLPCRGKGGARSRQTSKSERPKVEKKTQKHLASRSTSTASAEGKESHKDSKTYTSRETKSVKPQGYAFNRRSKPTTAAPAGDSSFSGRAGSAGAGGGGGGGGGGRTVGRQQQPPPQKQQPKDGQQKPKPKRYSNSALRVNQDPTRGLFVSEEAEDSLLVSGVPSATQLPSFRATYSPTRPSRSDSSEPAYPLFSHTSAQDCSPSSNADPWPSFESSTYYLAPSFPTTDSTQCTTDCDFSELKKQMSYRRRLEAKVSAYHSSFPSLK